LDEALDVARPTGEVQHLGPVYAARAEAAWLDNDLDSALQAAARAGFELAEQHGRDTFILAELACWRRRLGDVLDAPSAATGPFALEVVGDLGRGRGGLVALGCPYEAALACINGDETARRDAAREMQALGARRSAEAMLLRSSVLRRSV
jgi:hypothetical protein